MSGSLGGISIGGLTSFGFGLNKTEIGMLFLDVLTSEEIAFDGQATKYPVEDGTVISDHILEGSKTLKIAGLISTTEAYSFNLGGGKSRLIDALQTMEQLKKERKLIVVTTGLTQYEDMAIENLRASRSSNAPRDGNWFEVQVELRHIKKVTLRTAQVNAAEPAAGRTGQTGARSNSNANTASNSSSSGASSNSAASQAQQTATSNKSVASRLGSYFGILR